MAAHVNQYDDLYHQVVKQDGKRAPGRNIILQGSAPGRAATDSEITTSIGVLHNILAPPPPPVQVSVAPTVNDSSTPVGGTPSSGSNTAAGGTHINCIIQHESGGNPQAVNGQYGGIGQWSADAWQQDGGTRYASSPTGASYDQQLQVLQSEGDAGMSQQQGQYDTCG